MILNKENENSIYIQDIEYNENRPVIKVLFETNFTKEIIIYLRFFQVSPIQQNI